MISDERLAELRALVREQSNFMFLAVDKRATIIDLLDTIAELKGTEGFYEKLWKDFCSLQRGDATAIVTEVEKSRRTIAELKAENAKLQKLLTESEQAHAARNLYREVRDE